MPDVLIVSDSPGVRADVRSVLSGPDVDVREITSGRAALPSALERLPDLTVIDMQVGSMGGVATCMDLRSEAAAGRLGDMKILLLLDRRADVFLARRSGADGFLVKPLDPIRLRRAVAALLAGGTYEDATQAPATVPAGPA